MKISLIFGHQVPRPWDADSERRIFQQNLDAVELADSLGFHTAWTLEHHFLEEYSHAAAPEVWLGAASQRSKRIRLGHGVMQLPPGINHPARVAERVATLDLLSNGRVELGTGESSSVAELDGFRVDPGKKREMWHEALEVAVRCMTEEPFTGHEGEHVSLPPRNVVPKPLQKPHPPLWVACTRPDTIRLAAECGIGALSFSFKGAEAFGKVVEDYYTTLERAVPVGKAVNANTLCSLGDLVVGATDDEAEELIGVNDGWFGFGVAHYYVYGDHHPGREDLWAAFQSSKDDLRAHLARNDDPAAAGDRADWKDLVTGSMERHSNRDTSGIGGVDTLIERLKGFEAVGADQVAFLLPPLPHEINMQSLERFGKAVLPQFIERDEEHERAKQERLAPVIEAAMARVVDRSLPLDPDYSFGGVPESWDHSYQASEIKNLIEQTEQ